MGQRLAADSSRFDLRNATARDTWDLTLREPSTSSYRVRLSRMTPDRLMTHWAILDVSQAAGGSRIALDFIVTQQLNILPQGGHTRR